MHSAPVFKLLLSTAKRLGIVRNSRQVFLVFEDAHKFIKKIAKSSLGEEFSDLNFNKRQDDMLF